MLYPLSYGGAAGVPPLYPLRAGRPTLLRTPRRPARFAALLVAACLAPAAAAQPGRPVEPFVAHTGEGTVRGRVAGVGPNWSVTFADPAGEVAAGDLVSLRRADRPLPPWPRGPQVVLANGDRIRGVVAGGDTRAVRVVAGPGEWAVPLTALAAVWVAAPPSDAPADPTAYPWASTPRQDAVLLRNGDVLRGRVEGFAAEPAAVRIKTTTDQAPSSLPLSRVAAIAFDPTLARVRRPKEPFARVVAADGSRISLASASSDGTTLKGKTLFGAAVELPLADVVALDVLQGKAVYLSDLKPKRAAAEGYNGVAWPWAADRSAKGNPLRVGDQTFDKGLGTHPRTTLTYDLGGKYRRFEAVVGLDPVTGRRGVADMRVLVDGKPAPVEGLAGLTAAAPRTVSVDVSGAKELTLVVDYGAAGDVQADVNWGDARLIR